MSSSRDCTTADKPSSFFTRVQKPFPTVSDGKIDTLQFIEAAKSVVALVEKLGKVFAPVKYDMSGNIEKLSKCYSSETIKNETLQSMVLKEQEEGRNMATESLLWLTRALHFIEIFLEKVLEKASENTSDTMKKELTHAYESTIKRFHSWMTQQFFFIICHMCPTKDNFYKSLEVSDLDSFVKEVKIFLQTLTSNRNEIQTFYSTHKLDNNTIV